MSFGNLWSSGSATIDPAQLKILDEVKTNTGVPVAADFVDNPFIQDTTTGKIYFNRNGVVTDVESLKILPTSLVAKMTLPNALYELTATDGGNATGLYWTNSASNPTLLGSTDTKIKEVTTVAEMTSSQVLYLLIADDGINLKGYYGVKSDGTVNAISSNNDTKIKEVATVAEMVDKELIYLLTADDGANLKGYYGVDSLGTVKALGSDTKIKEVATVAEMVDTQVVYLLTADEGTNLKGYYGVKSDGVASPIHPKSKLTVDTIVNLAKIKKPLDGQMIQLTGDLPVISYYVFNNNAPKGIPVEDGTLGYWNRVNTSGLALVDKTSGGTATASSTYNTNYPADAIDNEKGLKGWATKKNGTDGDAATGIVGEWIRVKTLTPFVPNGFTFYRNSQQEGGWNSNDYSPTAWEFQATKDNGTNWITLSAHSSELITTNAEEKYFQIAPTSEEYDDYRFVFSASVRGDYVQLTEIQIVERTVASKPKTQIYKAPLADLTALQLIENPINGETRQLLNTLPQVLIYRFSLGRVPVGEDVADKNATGAWVKDIAITDSLTFIGVTALAAAIPTEPTQLELRTYIANPANNVPQGTAYFTGTDTTSDLPTYAMAVDSSRNSVLIESKEVNTLPYSKHIHANTDFNYKQYVIDKKIAKGTPITIVNTDTAGGIGIGIDDSKTLKYKAVGQSMYSSVSRGTEFILRPNQLVILSYDDTNIYATVSGTLYVGYLANIATLKAIPSNSLLTGSYAHVGATLWTYDGSNGDVESDNIIKSTDNTAPLGRWISLKTTATEYDNAKPWVASRDYKIGEVFLFTPTMDNAVDKTSKPLQNRVQYFGSYDVDTTASATLDLTEIAKVTVVNPPALKDKKDHIIVAKAFTGTALPIGIAKDVKVLSLDSNDIYIGNGDGSFRLDDKNNYTDFMVADIKDPKSTYRFYSANGTFIKQSEGSGLRTEPVATIVILKALSAREFEKRLVRENNSTYVFELTANLTPKQVAEVKNLSDDANTGKWVLLDPLQTKPLHKVGVSTIGNKNVTQTVVDGKRRVNLGSTELNLYDPQKLIVGNEIIIKEAGEYKVFFDSSTEESHDAEINVFVDGVVVNAGYITEGDGVYRSGASSANSFMQLTKGQKLAFGVETNGVVNLDSVQITVEQQAVGSVVNPDLAPIEAVETLILDASAWGGSTNKTLLNGKTWTDIKNTYKEIRISAYSPRYTDPSEPVAWGYTVDVDTIRNGVNLFEATDAGVARLRIANITNGDIYNHSSSMASSDVKIYGVKPRFTVEKIDPTLVDVAPLEYVSYDGVGTGTYPKSSPIAFGDIREKSTTTNNISYNTTTKKFTLKGGFRYKLHARITTADTAPSPYPYDFRDASGRISQYGYIQGFNYTMGYQQRGDAYGIFEPTVDTEIWVELHKTDINAYGGSFVRIEQMTTSTVQGGDATSITIVHKEHQAPVTKTVIGTATTIQLLGAKIDSVFAGGLYIPITGHLTNTVGITPFGADTEVTILSYGE